MEPKRIVPVQKDDYVWVILKKTKIIGAFTNREGPQNLEINEPNLGPLKGVRALKKLT